MYGGKSLTDKEPAPLVLGKKSIRELYGMGYARGKRKPLGQNSNGGLIRLIFRPRRQNRDIYPL